MYHICGHWGIMRKRESRDSFLYSSVAPLYAPAALLLLLFLLSSATGVSAMTVATHEASRETVNHRSEDNNANGNKGSIAHVFESRVSASIATRCQQACASSCQEHHHEAYKNEGNANDALGEERHFIVTEMEREYDDEEEEWAFTDGDELTLDAPLNYLSAEDVDEDEKENNGGSTKQIQMHGVSASKDSGIIEKAPSSLSLSGAAHPGEAAAAMGRVAVATPRIGKRSGDGNSGRSRRPSPKVVARLDDFDLLMLGAKGTEGAVLRRHHKMSKFRHSQEAGQRQRHQRAGRGNGAEENSEDESSTKVSWSIDKLTPLSLREAVERRRGRRSQLPQIPHPVGTPTAAHLSISSPMPHGTFECDCGCGDNVFITVDSLKAGTTSENGVHTDEDGDGRISEVTGNEKRHRGSPSVTFHKELSSSSPAIGNIHSVRRPSHRSTLLQQRAPRGRSMEVKASVCSDCKTVTRQKNGKRHEDREEAVELPAVADIVSEFTENRDGDVHEAVENDNGQQKQQVRVVSAWVGNFPNHMDNAKMKLTMITAVGVCVFSLFAVML